MTAWEEHLDRMYGQASSIRELDFLIDGEAFYSFLENAIDKAQHSIDLQTYLFDNDDVAEAIGLDPFEIRLRGTQLAARDLQARHGHFEPPV